MSKTFIVRVSITKASEVWPCHTSANITIKYIQHKNNKNKIHQSIINTRPRKLDVRGKNLLSSLKKRLTIMAKRRVCSPFLLFIYFCVLFYIPYFFVLYIHIYITMTQPNCRSPHNLKNHIAITQNIATICILRWQ